MEGSIPRRHSVLKAVFLAVIRADSVLKAGFTYLAMTSGATSQQEPRPARWPRLVKATFISHSQSGWFAATKCATGT